MPNDAQNNRIQKLAKIHQYLISNVRPNMPYVLHPPIDKKHSTHPINDTNRRICIIYTFHIYEIYLRFIINLAYLTSQLFDKYCGNYGAGKLAYTKYNGK